MTDEEAFEKWNEQSDPCDPERATQLIELMQAVLRQAFIAGRESMRAENVNLTKHKMPEPHQLVIVAGGVACWTGSVWLSKTADSSGRPIEWEVKWWMPVIYSTEPPKPEFIGTRRAENFDSDPRR